MLYGYTLPLDNKETKLGNSDQEAPPSANKNSGVVLVPCCAWKCVPKAIALGLLLAIFLFSGTLVVICYSKWVFSETHKNYFENWCLMNWRSIFLILTYFWLNEIAMLSNGRKPDSFTNIWDLCSNFIGCESLFESNSPDIFALCETNLNDSIVSSSFTVKGYLLLFWKDSVTHMHGLPVYVKYWLTFA